MCRLGDNDAERMVTYMNAGYRAVRDFAAKYDKKIKTVFMLQRRMMSFVYWGDFIPMSMHLILMCWV